MLEEVHVPLSHLGNRTSLTIEGTSVHIHTWLLNFKISEDINLKPQLKRAGMNLVIHYSVT